MIKNLGKIFIGSFLAVMGLSFGAFAAEVTDPTVGVVGDTYVSPDGVEYEKIEDDAWKIIGYTGTDTDLVIPDTIADYNYVTEIQSGAFDGGGENIVSIELPQYLERIRTSSFDGLPALEEIRSRSANFVTDDGLLYVNNKLFFVPKGKTGNLSIMDGCTGPYDNTSTFFLNGDYDDFYVPDSFNVINENGYGYAYVYTFAGAKIKNFTGPNAVDGALFDAAGTRLIGYGTNATADLSGITSANLNAFDSFATLEAAGVPDAVKETTPFAVYPFEHALRKFYINGEIAYCMNKTKSIPMTVGAMEDTLAGLSDEKKEQLTLLLYAGSPYDGLGIANALFGDAACEAAGNATGALVWEVMGGYTADSDDVYDPDGFGTTLIDDYIAALRNIYQTGVHEGTDVRADVLDNHTISYYPAVVDGTQNLVLRTDRAPVPKTTYQIDKSWISDTPIAEEDNITAFFRLYRRIAGDEFAPTGRTIEIRIIGTEGNQTYTFDNLDAEDAAGNPYEYIAYEMNPQDHDAQWDGSELQIGDLKYTAEFAYDDGIAVITDRFESTNEEVEKTTYQIDKSWVSDTPIAEEDNITAYFRLYRKIDGGEFVPTNHTVEMHIIGTEGNQVYTFENLDAKDAAGNYYEYIAREMNPQDHDMEWDGSEIVIGNRKYTAEFNHYGEGTAITDRFETIPEGVETVRYEIDKSWISDTPIDESDNITAYFKLYRKTEGTEFEPTDKTVVMKIIGTEGNKTYTIEGLPKYNDAGNEYIYQAFEMNPNDNNAIWDGSEVEYKGFKTTATAAYEANKSVHTDDFKKPKSRGGISGSYSGSYSGGGSSPAPAPVQQAIEPAPQPAPEPVAQPIENPTPVGEKGERRQPKTGDVFGLVMGADGLLAALAYVFVKKKKF